MEACPTRWRRCVSSIRSTGDDAGGDTRRRVGHAARAADRASSQGARPGERASVPGARVRSAEGEWPDAHPALRRPRRGAAREGVRRRIEAGHPDRLAPLRRELVAELPAGQPSDLADLYSRLVAEGRMASHEVFQRFYEIGTPAGLAETERYLRERPRRPNQPDAR